MGTGARVNTTTNAQGFYQFAGVSNGTYRLVFTMTGRNAKISGAVVMNNNAITVNETNFMPGNNHRALLVRLTGIQNQNPPGTNVILIHTQMRELTPPGANATDQFWHCFSDGSNEALGGVGTLIAISPGYANFMTFVTMSNYVNNVALVTINLTPGAS